MRGFRGLERAWKTQTLALNCIQYHVVRSPDLRLQVAVAEPLGHIHVSDLNAAVLRQKGI